ncbi:PHB depolymerase family esterase [Roseomonas sp. OT10]|uniref:extracellular catalytic domain type 1 short-chain-length polyhydroxyalkanoate depolymerase n=1 Tax=Roseomonas cutis TaxID=2897332 RepID=UPI001E3BA907|nr:PHB depolymerase family esterase [Roseomonas sp. OT10]UFN48754.1 PHB depolymerase family esterase [Roseomonas sp. OT10]
MKTPRSSLSDLVRRTQATARAATTPPARPLQELTGFGSDPGSLRGLAYVPDGLPDGAPLVVALHGCTQTAAAYDRGCGWSDLAERMGFALLLPEQRRANNANLCFNWFEPGDVSRDQGEAASIRQMVAAMLERHRLDPRRVFVTGLSAGGAMTAALLAAYPDVFAAGGIVAGLPHGAASGVTEAFEAMGGGRDRPAGAWAEAARAASPAAAQGQGWPRVTIWHGDADRTVAVKNAAALAAQWVGLHGLPVAPDRRESQGVDTCLQWRGRDGRVAVECHIVAGMGHGVPLRPGSESGQSGEAAPYLLDVGLSSSHAIAAFWGLAERPGWKPAPRPANDPVSPWPDAIPASLPTGLPSGLPTGLPGMAAEATAGRDPGSVIRRALTAAGLMRP